MKQLLCLTLLLLALVPASAFADSITIYLRPNCCGDNFAYVKRTGGHVLVVDGGTGGGAFSSDIGFPSGYTMGYSTELWLNTPVYIDGSPREVSFSVEPTVLYFSSITFPTNGKDYNPFVTIAFADEGFLVDTGEPFSVSGSASGRMSFSYTYGLYYYRGFEQAPEPGTLALMGTGLIIVLGLARKKSGNAPNR